MNIILKRGLIIFHRIFGLTFGGLTIDLNGRLSFNRIYKCYEILVAFGILIYDLSSAHSVFGNIAFLDGENIKEKSPFLFAMMYIMNYVWSLFIYITNLTSIFNGKKIIQIIAKILSMENKTKNQPRWIIFAIIGLAQFIGMSVLSIMSMAKDMSVMKFASMVKFHIAFVMFLAIAMGTWLISIFTSQILDQINENLKKFIQMKSGKISFNICTRNNKVRVDQAHRLKGIREGVYQKFFSVSRATSIRSSA